MASNVEIANRALQNLGAKRITSLTDDSVQARAVNACFDTLRQSELRKHPWNFAIQRIQLAKSSISPTFVKDNSFPLPSDCLRVLPNDPDYELNSKDWQIEGRVIVTNDSPPLNVRYIKDVTDPNQMDVLFREALSARIALELAEELTQSNTKKADLKALYDEKIAEAKKANAIERIPVTPFDDTWITVRA